MSAVSGPSMATNIASIIRSLHPNQTRALSQKSNVHRQLISSHPLCQLSAITSPASRQYHGFSPRQTHCLSRPQRSIYQHHPSTSAHQHRAFHGIANRKFTTATPSQQPATPSPAEPATNEPTPISTDEYHKLSDAYIDTLVSQLEEMQEEREDVDVEYSVRSLSFPPLILAFRFLPLPSLVLRIPIRPPLSSTIKALSNS